MAESVGRLTTVRQQSAVALLEINGVQQNPPLLAPKVSPGDVGKPITVSTNLWGVVIPPLSVHLYHVTIEGVYPNGRQVAISGRYRDDALEVGRKDRCRAVFHALLRKHAGVLPSTNACFYDLQSFLFTLQPLKTTEWKCADIMPEDLEGVDDVNGFARFEVHLRKAGSTPDPHCNTDDLSGVLAQNLDDLNTSLTQFLEILLHQYALFNPQEHVCYEGATTYRMDPVACGFDPRDCFYLLPQFKSFAETDVGDVYLAVGNRAVVKFIEGPRMRKSMGSIGVIIETRKSPFYAVGNFYEKCDRVTRGAVHDIRGMTEEDFDAIRRLFTGKQVFATHRPMKAKPFKIYSISQNMTANSEMIARDGAQISISRYYRLIYGIQLEHPDAPLVESRIRRGRDMAVLWYPIEVLQFMDNQRVKFNEQDPRMVRGILKGSAVLPVKRQEQNRLNVESHHLNDRVRNPYMAAASASVTTKPLEVPARILPAPAVQFASGRLIAVEDADGCTWKHPRNDLYLRPAIFPDTWGVLFISVGAADDLTLEQVELFVTKHFLPACGARGMQTRQQSFLHIVGTNEAAFVADLRALKEEYPTLEFLFVIHTNHETAACHSKHLRLSCL
ncbi:WAGO-2 protein [Aphelenchoides avenae]|nr:WAGO-2 protein [Aphelenchus avenae]